MSAQTPTAPEMSSDVGQQTPVTIKTGGNVDEVSVSIESPRMPFDELVQAPSWVVSQSTFRRRINQLKIDEAGKTDYCARKSSQLVNIKIEFGDDGAAQLLVLESGDPDSADISLVLVSVGVSFNVDKVGQWEIAKATFPPMKRVVFREGTDLILDHVFTSLDAQLEVHHQALS